MKRADFCRVGPGCCRCPSRPVGQARRAGADLRGRSVLAEAAAESLGDRLDDRPLGGRPGPRLDHPSARVPSRTTSRPPTSRAEAVTTRCSRREAVARRSNRAAARSRRRCSSSIRPATSSKSWGGPGAGYEWPDSNHGITVDHKGNVWIGGNGDKDTQVLKFTKAGKFLLQIGKQGVHNGSNDVGELLASREDLRRARRQRGLHRRRLRQPPRHRLRRRHRQVQAALGRLRQQAGRREGAAATTRRRRRRSSSAPCTASIVSNDGFVYVCDRVNDRIQVFRKDGTFVKEAFIDPKTLPLRIGLGHDLLARSAADLHLHGQRREREDQHRCCAARSRCSRRSATAAGSRASSSASTTWPPTRRATSTRPRPTPARACSASSTRASARSPRRIRACPGRASNRS